MLSKNRQMILNRIRELEKLEAWDKDVEDDPITIPLTEDKVDYLYKKPINKILNKIANRCAINFFEKKIKQGQLIIKEIRGIENYIKVKDEGVIITCNHFNAFDNYVVYRVIRPYLGKKNLHKIIREGNFTNFPGLYGFFFRHCNTLPLASNIHVMKKFLSAVSTLLKNKEKVLIYPEQGMWWNYKKPRPMQNGAFKLASQNNVPILPMFISMEDTDKLDGDGYPIQAYTVHILPAIYKNEKLSNQENVEYLKNENYNLLKQTYEEFYKKPLVYGEEK